MGYAPHYGVFPHQPVEAIAHSDVRAVTVASVRPGSTDAFVLEQSTKDHKEGGANPPPMNLRQLKRCAKEDPDRHRPRCVITQASGKQRLIDDAARGGQSASSRDANKLVCAHRSALLPTFKPPRPAFRSAPGSNGQEPGTTGRMPIATIPCLARRLWPVWWCGNMAGACFSGVPRPPVRPSVGGHFRSYG